MDFTLTLLKRDDDSLEAGKPASTSQVLTAFVTNSIFFSAFILVFILLRMKLKRVYEPKSSFDLINDEKKPEPLPRGPWQWLLPLLKKSDNFIIQQAGIDGYFFLRFLLIISMYCFVSLVYVLPILLPVNAANGVKHSGFDMLAYTNVIKKPRYYAHVFVGWVFYWGFLFVIYRELVYYTSVRQAVLSSPRYARKLSSRTVMFQSVPEKYLLESEFPKLFVGVKNVWIARGAGQLEKKVSERDAMAMQLEAAMTKYLKTAVKKIAKLKKKNPDYVPSTDIAQYVPQNKRPTHRLKFLIGKKVDTIDFLKEELPKLNADIIELQSNHDEAKPFNSVFVEFESQYHAQIAVQSTIHHEPLKMTPAYAGIRPQDIVWFNTRMHWLERTIRKFGAVAAIIALIILWAFPVAFVGLISNINYLTDKLPWLRFIYHLPERLMGLLTAMAPTIALAVLMMLLPIIIRKMALVAGAPSVQHIEYFTQQAFFGFQFVQVFLVTTIASSATSVVTQIVKDPTSSMSLLATNLPKSSNFYVAYIMLQGLTVSSGALLQIVSLILFYVLGYLLDGTARKKWSRFTGLGSMQWGTTFPVYTNLAVIVFSYAIIAPIILLFAAVAFLLLYVAYLYNLTYVFQESAPMRGICYPRALFQTFVGLYVGQICLLGLFAVGKGWGPIVLQVVCIAVTVFIHLNFNIAFDNLMQVVPMDTMKPLDGKSNTPSFVNKPGSQDSKEGVKQLPHFPIRKYQPRSSLHLDQNTKSLRSENTFEVNATMASDNENNLATVPLLADGEETSIPAAPFWKRYFQPHIYLSYKVARSILPEIYNLPDPEDTTDADALKNAYNYPAVGAKCPMMWVPRDPYGFSDTQLTLLGSDIPMSDEGAGFDEKGNIIWTSAPPSYEAAMKEKNPFEEEEENEAF
ncbi:LAMI_0A05138g1_1 [Lachancea mirantina]|uniref:LAMI_0A05138g1_1 n=1 Tax=Lachancea mirantina TaxID=1230905 RepID=A0A1G4IPK2_9SACH|nr:LAMI_0A05138g1_1 [Lachancea mirantina]